MKRSLTEAQEQIRKLKEQHRVDLENMGLDPAPQQQDNAFKSSVGIISDDTFQDLKTELKREKDIKEDLEKKIAEYQIMMSEMECREAEYKNTRSKLEKKVKLMDDMQTKDIEKAMEAQRDANERVNQMQREIEQLKTDTKTKEDERVSTAASDHISKDGRLGR
mmetsp:Transcript_15993/g.21537  ORF Transcript_15993/g.21537 Transcript_15993/m.21537 type:complete len:164 (-) Transcript_15993:188-679(-)|eukprot:CAMPEP_0185793176 /NCGR_PEP_ID=MMETSP1174-20130828/159328_1 /TAXON_ID=35687 /ORGANISM="Dictyocha speculum, Strain CCMP1381" /LENGTH=163 /DNA_ID=CAMNT_0028488293 /DNA_START=47 /DNA_END=538 /DNA_ORIENTATION=-